MVLISVSQFINGKEIFLGDLQQPSREIAISLLGELQQTILNPELVYLPLRQHSEGLLVINLTLGAVKFHITG